MVKVDFYPVYLREICPGFFSQWEVFRDMEGDSELCGHKQGEKTGLVQDFWLRAAELVQKEEPARQTNMELEGIK